MRYPQERYSKLSKRWIQRISISNINKGPDEQVEAFRNRPLQAEHPFIYIDAHQGIRNAVKQNLQTHHGNATKYTPCVIYQPMFLQEAKHCFQTDSNRRRISSTKCIGETRHRGQTQEQSCGYFSRQRFVLEITHIIPDRVY